jgi:hypothetical protein
MLVVGVVVDDDDDDSVVMVVVVGLLNWRKYLLVAVIKSN